MEFYKNVTTRAGNGHQNQLVEANGASPLVKHSDHFHHAQPAESNNGPDLRRTERNNFMGPELLEKLQKLGDRGAWRST